MPKLNREQVAFVGTMTNRQRDALELLAARPQTSSTCADPWCDALFKQGFVTVSSRFAFGEALFVWSITNAGMAALKLNRSDHV